MKITQVDYSWAKANSLYKNLYRISLCDDSNYGRSKHHFSARLKLVGRLSAEDMAASKDPSMYSFILIEED